MCWRDPAERYNDGGGLQGHCAHAARRDRHIHRRQLFRLLQERGQKPYISYSANLFGGVEEEHAGGALAFASYSLGFEFDASNYSQTSRTVADVAHDDPDALDLQPEGYALDTHCPDLIYVPPDAKASVTNLKIWWRHDDHDVSLRLTPGKTYMTPSGYKVRLEKHPGAASWRLVGTVAEGLLCHKPCTVSGGGKSEISKNLRDYMIYGPIFVADMEADFELVQQIVDRDYSDRWKPGREPDYAERPAGGCSIPNGRWAA